MAKDAESADALLDRAVASIERLNELALALRRRLDRLKWLAASEGITPAWAATNTNLGTYSVNPVSPIRQWSNVSGLFRLSSFFRT